MGSRPSPASVWWGAVRPRTLGAAVAPVVVGTAMAWDAGAFHGPSAFAAMLGAVLIQIGTNFANDYFDFVKGADTADRMGPTRATAAGLVPPETMRRATILAFALVFVPGAYILYRGGWPFLVVGLVSIACGVLYTGGPYPLAYLGLGDLFVLVFFGPVAVGGTYYLQTFDLPPEAIVAGLGPGLLSTAVLTVNNLRDIAGDRIAGKKTLAVRFGPRFARAEYLACLALGAAGVPVALVLMTGTHWPVALAALVLIPAARTVQVVLRESGPALNAALGATGKWLVLYSALFAIGWLR